MLRCIVPKSMWCLLYIWYKCACVLWGY